MAAFKHVHALGLVQWARTVIKRPGKTGYPPFCAAYYCIGTRDFEAWRAMSHGARSLYVALKRRYNSSLHNNGRIFPIAT